MTYILGFDGGGTKTECVLLNGACEVLARTIAGPSNSSRIGVEAAVRHVEEAAESALKEVNLRRDDVNAIGAGLAGTTDAQRSERVRAALQAAFPRAQLTLMTDLDAALAAAPEGPAMVLVAGTGSAAIGRNTRGETARVGGYGRFSSDEGSAFDIGRKAIAAAMNERERNGQDSQLGASILEQLQCKEWSVVRQRAQEAPDAVFPPIFPVIAAAADSGDELARGILRDAAKNLGELAAEAAKQLCLEQAEFALVKIGGMMGRSRVLDAELARALTDALPTGRERKLRISPAEAAALIAKDAHAGE